VLKRDRPASGHAYMNEWDWEVVRFDEVVQDGNDVVERSAGLRGRIAATGANPRVRTGHVSLCERAKEEIESVRSIAIIARLEEDQRRAFPETTQRHLHVVRTNREPLVDRRLGHVVHRVAVSAAGRGRDDDDR
jgi:hypothetical protein